MKPPRWLDQVVKHIWPDNVDAYILVAIAVLASVLQVFGGLSTQQLGGVFLAVIALLCVVLIRDRSSRASLTKQLEAVAAQTRPSIADKFFGRKSPEEDLLAQCQGDVSLIQETGSLVLEKSSADIIRLLNAGRTVRFIVTVADDQRSHFLAFRNENLTGAPAFAGRLQHFHAQLAYVKAHTNNPMALQVRHSFYDVGYTTVMTSKGERSPFGQALVRLAGFRIPYSMKLDFQFDEQSSPVTYAHFAREFEVLFRSCAKILLISSDPGIGKTTLVEQLVREHGTDPNLFWVLSKARVEGDQRRGFYMETSAEPACTDFATRHDATESPGDVRQYAVDVGVWDQLATEVLAAAREHKVLVLDELGEMQLQSQAFRRAVEEILENRATSVLATIPSTDRGDALIRQLRSSPRSTILNLDATNRDSTLAVAKAEFEGSLRLARFIRQSET